MNGGGRDDRKGRPYAEGGRAHYSNALPRGEGGPKGRVRNSGGNPKVNTNKQTSSQIEVQEEVFKFP